MLLRCVFECRRTTATIFDRKSLKVRIDCAVACFVMLASLAESTCIAARREEIVRPARLSLPPHLLIAPFFQYILHQRKNHTFLRCPAVKDCLAENLCEPSFSSIDARRFSLCRLQCIAHVNLPVPVRCFLTQPRLPPRGIAILAHR